MDNEYVIECPICDIQSIVRVPYDDEVPRHCPMCGEDIDADLIEDDE